jgi:hypothetical protein
MAEREIARNGMAGDVEDVFGDDELGLATWSDEEAAEGAETGGSGRSETRPEPEDGGTAADAAGIDN